MWYDVAVTVRIGKRYGHILTNPLLEIEFWILRVYYVQTFTMTVKYRNQENSARILI